MEKVLCPNHLYCGNDELYGIEFLDCYNGVCSDCDMNFGDWKGGSSKLTFSESVCPVCLEENIVCVDFPTCKIHKICINCFKKIINPEFPIEEPVLSDEKYDFIESIDDQYDLFDFSEETQREKDSKYPVWYKEFQILYQNWEDEIEEFYDDLYDSREIREKCPICRKGFKYVEKDSQNNKTI